MPAAASVATRVVEFRTSCGVFTIYLAAAVRDNLREQGLSSEDGVVIGTELVPATAERAHAHLVAAGLESFVDVRVGDALSTLCDLPGPVDFLLNVGFPSGALPVLRLLQPVLRAGAVVLADNVGAFPADHRDYLAYDRDPRNGFCSSGLDRNEGSEFGVRLAHGPAPG